LRAHFKTFEDIVLIIFCVEDNNDFIAFDIILINSTSDQFEFLLQLLLFFLDFLLDFCNFIMIVWLDGLQLFLLKFFNSLLQDLNFLIFENVDKLFDFGILTKHFLK